ncbi:MAG: CSLREA domain-containing protein [Candidatus Promineifilaceae bacterium]|nr:CSLREA domain-containing protein [Candidatus Promineifilaceae bacterium]
MARRGAARPFSTAASEAGIVVNSLADEMVDDGNCTLREALQAANTNAPVDGCRRGSPNVQDRITFRGDGTIFLTDALAITEGVQIQGNGQEATILDGHGAALDTALLHSSFTSHLPDVALTELTVQHAKKVAGGSGGAVFSGTDVV